MLQPSALAAFTNSQLGSLLVKMQRLLLCPVGGATAGSWAVPELRSLLAHLQDVCKVSGVQWVFVLLS